MKTKEEIIEYLGIEKDYTFYKHCINYAMYYEKKYQREIELEEIGYGLTCYFEDKHQREMLEDLRFYDLIVLDSNRYITTYRKVFKISGKSKENILDIIDSNNEFRNEMINMKLGLSIDLYSNEGDRKEYPISVWLNDSEYDYIRMECLKKCLVGKCKFIYDELENNLKKFEKEVR